MNNQIMYKNTSQKKGKGTKKSQEININIYKLKGTLKKSPKTHKKKNEA